MVDEGVSAPPARWVPQPGGQFRFLTCPVFEALLHGTRGGGKTDALLMTFAAHVGRGYGPHWRGILFRLTYPQLADVVAKTRRWFSQIFPSARFNKAEYVWEWPDGEMLFLRYGQTADDYWNYHGHEYPWIGFEELTNWRDLSFYTSMHSTCRSSFAGMPRMIRSTCNPFGRGHGVVKERFRLGAAGAADGEIIREPGQHPRVAIRSSIMENLVLLKNDPQYLQTLEGITDPARRSAWLQGDWDIHTGSFLEGIWDSTRHVVSPFPIPEHWRVWRAMDWGYSRPYAVVWLAVCPDGVHYVWRELYGCTDRPNEGTRESAAEVARKIHEIEKHDERLGRTMRYSLADPSIFTNHGAERSIGGIFRDAGVKWLPAWNGRGSRANGAQEIIRLLSEGRLKVFSTCRHWLRTIPALAPDDVNPDDVDTEGEDHLWDATRYAVMHRRALPAQPETQSHDDAYYNAEGANPFSMKV